MKMAAEEEHVSHLFKRVTLGHKASLQFLHSVFDFSIGDLAGYHHLTDFHLSYLTDNYFKCCDVCLYIHILRVNILIKLANL